MTSAQQWRRIPSPISFAEFDSSVLLSRVSLHLNSTICIDNGNGNEDKDKNIDSVYSEVGVDSTRCWDNRVIRDGPLVGLKVAEGTYQSSDSPIHTHYSLFKHLFSDSVHIPLPGSALQLDDKQFSQAKAIRNADINSNPLLILGVSYILPKGTIRPIY